VEGRSDFPLADLDPGSLEHGIRLGLGAWAARVSRHAEGNLAPVLAQKVEGAALSARILIGTMLDALAGVLEAANRAGCTPLLLKGAACAQRYYPQPELRTMGDLDLLVSPSQRETLEGELLRLGYVQRSELGAGFYEGHQHSMPFWHAERRVWVEVHARLTHVQHVLASAPIFDTASVLSHGQTIEFRGQRALVMPPELELAYLCARWTETFDAERGLWPLLDVALLCRTQAGALDWGEVTDLAAREPLLATAVNLALGFLSRTGLVALPDGQLEAIARHDRVTNRASRAILWRIVEKHIVGGGPSGRIATAFNLSLVWSTLLAPRPAVRNLCALPSSLIFPPGQSFAETMARLARGLGAAKKPEPD